MPQEEKFITRKQGGIGYQDTDYTQTKKGMKANSGAYRKATAPSYNRLMSLDRERRADRAGFDPFEMGKARDAFDKASSNAYSKQYAAEEKATNRAVTGRDATNTRIARERLASRASTAKAQPRGGGMMAKAAALGPVAEGAAAMYAADEATGFRRTKYSGPSGGPSFSMNPYASSNKSAYNGQSAMSKAMGVGKKK